MNILGISAFGQNPAACLLAGGKLIAFAEEERFIRIKTAVGRFPDQAIAYCLDEGGMTINDINGIAFGWDHARYRAFIPFFSAKLWLRHAFLRKYSSTNRGLVEMLTLHPSEIKKQLEFHLSALGLKGRRMPDISYIPHHLAHAASSYYASGFPDALVAVIDGSGEERTTTLYKAHGKELEEITHFSIPHSLGWLYAAFTAYLGFRPSEDDGFVMGLSSYGKPSAEYREKIGRIIQIRGGSYTVDPSYTLLGPHTKNEHFSDRLITLLGPNRLTHEPVGMRHKLIAYALQEKLEEVVLQLVKTYLPASGSRNLCLAGGVALNSKMNGKLAASGMISGLFIQPSGNDAGSALGAAMIASARAGEDPRFRMEHARWGPGYTDTEIQTTLDEAMVSYSRPKNIEKTVARALAAGKIVARFDGRMEAGPRALGGRSILADATRKGMDDIINKKIKHRDPWRPFCPSMTAEVSAKYYVNPMEDRFMTVIYDVPASRQKEISAVVHVDGTSRPQAVSKKIDPSYHSIIKQVGELTGTPVILNTSFNVKGEPIVCRPADALRCFAGTGIDAMAIGGFWIEK
jgi:carbamoyltransferase